MKDKDTAVIIIDVYVREAPTSHDGKAQTGYTHTYDEGWERTFGHTKPQDRNKLN
jgi:hypothetical protein